MPRWTPLVLSMTLCLVASAQEGPDCRDALEGLIAKVEREYPGFAEKTTDRRAYESFRDEMIACSQSTPDPACLDLLRAYLAFFQDHHLQVVRTGGGKGGGGGGGGGARGADDGKPAARTGHDRIDQPLATLRERIVRSDDPLEGIWRGAGYEVGIVARDGHHQAFVIEADTTYWKPGEIKFRLHADGRADFYLRDHSLRESGYTVHRGSVLHLDAIRSPFVKIEPAPPLSPGQIEQTLAEIDGFFCRRLSDRTVLLRLASFGYDRVERIERLLDESQGMLRTCENLIVDLRDNPGGTDQAYRRLLPYLCTGPVRTMGGEYLATPTLVNGLRDYLDQLPAEERHAEDRRRILRMIEVFSARMGEFVELDSQAVHVTEIATAEAAPRHVVVLVNGRTGSAAESLVYKARQSWKVKILGTPSGGVLDYGSARWTGIGCDRYRLSIPTYRSLRLPDYPLDNIGLQPDVYLDRTVDDWVAFARDYLEGP